MTGGRRWRVHFTVPLPAKLHRVVAFIALLAFGGISTGANASGLEICQLQGEVTAMISPDSAATYFRLWVEDARPTACLGLSSQDPSACARYVEQALEVGLSTTDAPTIGIGDRVQLVQTVVDMTASSNAGAQQINWRSLQACEESKGD